MEAKKLLSILKNSYKAFSHENQSLTLLRNNGPYFFSTGLQTVVNIVLLLE